MSSKTEVTAIFVLVAIIAIVMLMLTDINRQAQTTPQGGDERAVPEEIERCVTDNPTMLEEECWDLRYHDTAIAEGDPALCENIISETLKSHCKRYFE